MSNMQLNTEVIYKGVNIGRSASEIEDGDIIEIYKILCGCIVSVDNIANFISGNNSDDENEISDKTRVFFDIYNQYFEMLSEVDKKYWVRLVLRMMVSYFEENYDKNRGYQGFVKQLLSEYDICKFIRVNRLKYVSVSLYGTKIRNVNVFTWSLKMIVEGDKSQSLFKDISFLTYEEWESLGYSFFEIIEYYQNFTPFMKVFSVQKDLTNHQDLIKDLENRACLRLFEIGQGEKMPNYEYALLKNSDFVLNSLTSHVKSLTNEKKDVLFAKLESLLDLCFENKEYSQQFVYVADILNVLENEGVIDSNGKVGVKERFPTKKIAKNLIFEKENCLYINVEYWIGLLQISGIKLSDIYGDDLVINIKEKIFQLDVYLRIIKNQYQNLRKHPERKEEYMEDLELSESELMRFIANEDSGTLIKIEKELEKFNLDVKFNRVIDMVNLENKSILGIKVIADSKYYEIIRIVLETMLLREVNNDDETGHILDAIRAMVTDKCMRLDLENAGQQNSGSTNMNVKISKF